jgi:integrase
MPRPRIYVDRHGRPVQQITGVHYNKGRNRFYITLDHGARQEFRSWEDARAAFVTAQANAMPAEELARIAAIARYRSDLAQRRLYDDERYAHLRDEPIMVRGGIVPGGPSAGTILSFAESANALADQLGVPRVEIERSRDALGTGPRLVDIIEAFTRHKKEEKGRLTPHHREVARRWGWFVGQVGNLFVAQLQPQHFRVFHSWAAREGSKRQSAKWQKDTVETVKSVLKYVRRKYPEWPWPAGVLEWAGSYDVKPYKAKASNREPMSVATFRAYIEACRAWARTDVEQFEANTQSGRGKRAQALRKKRDGVQFEAILHLGINCGLDPVDIERIGWSDLKLNGAVPHLRFAGRRVEASLGDAVERMTPLLPGTTRALERWRDFSHRGVGPVFLTARGGCYTRDRLCRTLNRLRTDANIADRATFKHLRNVGPTLARRAKLSRDERDAFLGHVVGGTSRFYEGDVDETYLVPLVNLIGVHYYGGEQVQDGRRRSSRTRKTTRKAASPEAGERRG